MLLGPVASDLKRMRRLVLRVKGILFPLRREVENP